MAVPERPGAPAAQPGVQVAPRGGMGGLGGAPVTMECEGETPKYTSGLSATAAYEYLALMRGGFSAPELVDESGTQCKTAADPTACAGAVASAGPDCYQQPKPGTCTEYGFAATGGTPEYHYYVRTQGDAVDDVSTAADLLKFLGTIDTPNEAAIVLWMNHKPVKCGEIYESPTATLPMVAG